MMQTLSSVVVRHIGVISDIALTNKKYTCISTGKKTFFMFRTSGFCCTVSDHLTDHRLDADSQIFQTFPYLNVNFCTKLIIGHTKSGRLKDALHLFDRMPIRDTIAWNSIIKGCLDCQSLTMARKFFDEMPERNVISWTTMINGYMQFGKVKVAEELFRVMPCRDVAAWNSLISGYFSNGRVSEALKVFEEMPCKNIISWTSMISGLDQNGRSSDALSIFKQMINYGIEPSQSTFPCLITACATLMDIEFGTQIHARILKLGCIDEVYTVSSLITFYANCKKPENISKIFKEISHANVVVWTSLLTGYGLNSMHAEALTVLCDMIKMGIFPNESSFTSALNSCCALMSLCGGQSIHAEAIKLGYEDSAFVGNSLVTLYSKCGTIIDAMKAFGRIKVKNLVSWNSIISGCAEHGCATWVSIFLAQILRAGLNPDEVTFTGLLSAASHSRMFLKASHFFLYFSKYTTVKINTQHYGCLVDLMCRYGELDKAEELIKIMPIKSNSLVLVNLLSACVMHSNIEVAERVSKFILDRYPTNSAAYTILSNIYASAGRWSDVSRVRSQMKRRKIAKDEGCSWLTQRGERCDFVLGNTQYPADKLM